jgi:leucyl aminopeptidase
MTHPLLSDSNAYAIPVFLLHAKQEWPDRLSITARNFLTASHFKSAPGKLAVLPGPDGQIEAVIMGVEDPSTAPADRLSAGRLATMLPAGDYRIETALDDPELAVLAFLMSSYRFTRYKASTAAQPHLVPPAGVDAARVSALCDAISMGRDLINTPAADLPPEALGQAALDLASKFSAQSRMVVGDALLHENFPMIHAVGRAAGQGSSRQAPRLAEFIWGPPDGLKLTLVGKGVTFDTGGLNLKPESAMLLMKKDMGGAAVALTAARMIMALDLPVHLRVIIPIAENAIAGDAFRPGDVLRSRKGLSVEIGNTDAEGRLILADALALAAEDPPDILLNYATLTGAARVALGPDLPAAFFNDPALAGACLAAGEKVADPVWQLPLWNGYDGMLDSSIADVNHIASGGMAGSIVAALFLRRFVPASIPWGHIDTFAWRNTGLPGRPAGGEPQAARLTLAMIEDKLRTSRESKTGKR